MNLLSEHNRILRVGEGGSQEYFAGPNINITDHVISGKYWDNEINSAISSTSGDIVNEAFNQSTAWTEEQGYLTAHQDVSNLPYVQNSALGYNGNLISSISGDGFFAESANNSYHADDADHATYADSATHADSADFVATANFANSASSALNAEVANVAYTALTAQFLDGGWELDVDGFITAYNNSAFAGNGGGGRYEGISPIVVNNEEMRISAKSALLGVQDPLYFVEDSETATVIGIHDSAFPTFEGTPDGKISAINGSALNADSVTEYSGGNNIDITDHIISVTGSVASADRADFAVSATSSHFSHSAIEAGSASYATESNHTHSADSATYDSLGRKIVDTYLTAHQELPDWTPTIQNASGNAYNSAVNWVVDQHYLTAVTGDNTPYSAGANIDITDHVVSGKDWGSDISAASSYAYEQATAQIPTELTGAYVPLSARTCTIGSANTAVGEALAQGTNNSADGDAFAQGLENSAKWSIAQGYRNIAETRSIAQGTENTANIDGFAQGNGNSAYDRAIAQGYNNTASTYALAQGYNNTASNESMAQGQQNSAYTNSFAQGFNNSANSDSFAQGSTNLAKENSIAQGYGNSAYNGSQALGYKNIMSGNGMAIGQYNKTSADAYFVIGNGSAETARSDAFIIFNDGSVSAKGDISANGIKLGAGGIEYEGIAPIVVNNVEHKISAQSAKLGVQSPLYFVEDSVSATVIGISGLPEGQDIMYESALGLSAGTITSYNNSAFGGGGVQSDWTETATTNLAYIKHKPSEYNLVAGQNVTLTLAGNDLTIDAIGGGSTISYTTGSI